MILAIAVIGICGSGLFAAFSTIINQNKMQPSEVTAAAALVREGLERVLADKRNTRAGYGFTHIIQDNYPEENLPGGYTRTTTIGVWPGSPVDDRDNTDNFCQVSIAVCKGGLVIGKATCLVVRY